MTIRFGTNWIITAVHENVISEYYVTRIVATDLEYMNRKTTASEKIYPGPRTLVTGLDPLLGSFPVWPADPCGKAQVRLKAPLIFCF